MEKVHRRPERKKAKKKRIGGAKSRERMKGAAVLQSYECFGCRKVSIFTGGEDQTKCNTCGSANIRLRSTADVVGGSKAGVDFNIDPKTGEAREA
jgi:hypothetical protein